MKTDKELLELAAKAAGLNDYEYVEETSFTHASMQRRNIGGPEDGFFELQTDVWSPLTDDGDALRLAVKLKFDVMTRWGEPNAAVLDQEGNFTMQADVDLDMCAATRRAIVRAAAAIGAKL